MRKLFKKIISILLIITNMFCINFNSLSNQSLNIIKPFKIKATTYFGNEWPTTFWCREHLETPYDFERIKKDGFNTIIFCIPWREIQPDFEKDFNQNIINEIDRLINIADEKGLKVLVRLGYTWDYYGDDSSVNRFIHIWTDNLIKKSWFKYVKKMYEVLVAHKNFIGGFITWEDFWPGLSQKYSSHKDRDKVLVNFLKESQKYFNNLSMECRIHEEDEKGNDGKNYCHEITYGCGDADYSSLLLSIDRGFEYNKIYDAMTAVSISEESIQKFSECNKPIFIDQFLFDESTPGYEFLSHIDNLNLYLSEMGKIFDKQVLGYGLWTSQDYVDNIIFNSEFAMGKKGWNSKGDVKTEKYIGNSMLYMNKNCEAEQDISWKGFLGKNNLICKMDVFSIDESDLEVEISGQKKVVHIIPGLQKVEIEFENKNTNKFILRSSQPTCIDNIKLYSTTINSNIYRLDMSEYNTAQGIRALNANID